MPGNYVGTIKVVKLRSIAKLGVFDGSDHPCTRTSENMLNVGEDSLVDSLPALDSCLVLAAGAAVQLAQLVQLVLHNHGDVLPVVRIVSLLQPLVHLEANKSSKIQGSGSVDTDPNPIRIQGFDEQKL